MEENQTTQTLEQETQNTASASAMEAEQNLRVMKKPTTDGKTAAEYTNEMLKYHQSQYHDDQPNKALKWVGNAALAVPPRSRFFGAIGLVLGLVAGTTVANTAVGYTPAGEAIGKVPSYLKWLRDVGSKMFKDYNPHGLENKNKYIKYLQMAIYSLGGGIGAKIGSEFAYKENVVKNRNPHYLEDYLTTVSHHQGETWSYLASGSSVLASSSGMWLWGLAIPGANYGEGLVGFITSMQDRNTMIPYLNGITSDATTPSYLRLKEGSHFLCEYAAGNPAKEPTDIEFLAYTILGPLFKDKLTAEKIKLFTDTVQAVRAPFWQEGGIPKERQKEAVATLKEVFTGAGLEVLLIDMGLNPATIAFDHVNGLIGKIGDIGQKDAIKKDQEAFWAAMQERLPKYVEAGEISKERADWVVAGIEAMKQGKKPPEAPETQKETFAEPSKDTATIHQISEAVANSDIHVKADPRNVKFSKNPNTGIGASIRSTPIRNLLARAAQPDDWAQTVLNETQNREPISIDHII